jgi:hypothetical protein
MNRKMLLESELVVATSGNPRDSHLMSAGQLWSGIKSLDIHATATTISNESVIRMTPGLSNFSAPMDRQLQAIMDAVYVLAYYKGRTHIYWKGQEVSGTESVQFRSSINDRQVDVKIVVGNQSRLDAIDHDQYPWVWVKSVSNALSVARTALA